MLRRVPSHARSVFLTFDDGPDPVGTPAVLEILRKHGARATFFVVASKVKAHPELLREILRAGHAVGNHSLDHKYHHFFRGAERLKDWISSAEKELRKEGAAPVGFRPPAGIVTPHLVRAARSLDSPLVMWNERFFDAVLPWGERRARRSAARLEGGSIVLLHDRQTAGRVNAFCKTLDTYLDCLKDRGLEFEPLTPEICRTGGPQ
jgi:peptidoglycan/xylan/chitin deacetylase (PgdA/CDA1 family)